MIQGLRRQARWIALAIAAMFLLTSIWFVL